MQVLQEAEHDFFWGKPSDSGQGRGATAPGGRDVARLPTSSAAAADGGSPVVVPQPAASPDGSPEGNRGGVVPCVQGSPAPRVVTADVSPSRLHGIIAAATLEDLLQALLDTLQASTASTAALEPYFGGGGGSNNDNWDTDDSSDQRLNRAGLEGGEGHAGAAVTGTATGSSTEVEVEVEEVVVALPPEVVEVALAKTAGWALDAGTFLGIDPTAVRRTIDLLQASMCQSRMTGYSLDHAESALWSLSSILGCYDWAPADGTTAVVQSWLCRTDILEQIQGCGRFAVLVSLLWGYAGLLQAQMRGVGERMQGAEVPYSVGGAAAAAERLPPPPLPPPAASLDASLDVLTSRAAELLRMSYDVGQPVDAAELTDAAWAVHVVGRMSPGSLELARAVAHEVYRQLSNRYSLQTAFTPRDLVKVVQSYAGMQLSDGSVARMLDAVGGHVAKRICSRHIHAVTRPADCAALLQAFADTGHNSVVVPELLAACALQISREVASHNEAFGPAITVAPAAAAPSASSSGPSTAASTPQPASELGHDPAPSTSADNGNSAGVRGGSSSSISGGGDGKSGKSGGVVSRFKLPHVPLWRRPVTTQTAQAAFWHWSTFLPPAQIFAVLQSYKRMGFVPRPTLLNSLLLAARPQLPDMDAVQVSGLLQLLAAVRHVPGDQTLASLAAAALRPHPIGGEPEAAADSNHLRSGSHSVSVSSSQPAHGVRQRGARRDSAAVQRLRALWALAMMGWEAEPEAVEDVLDPVMLDDDLVLGLEDAGRLMSLLCLLYGTPGVHNKRSMPSTQAAGGVDGDSRTPTGALTIQRFGLACAKLRDTMARIRDVGGGGGGSGWDLRDDVLLATGTAMTLLGFEGWEMAEQVLSASAFRKVEAAVRQALERPYDSLDESLVRTLKRAVDEVPGCSAAVESIAVPIVVPEAQEGAAASAAGASGPGASYHKPVPDPDFPDDDAAAAYYEPLAFRPLVVRLAPDGGEQAEAGTVVHPDPPGLAEAPRKADGEDREGPGGVELQGPAPPNRTDGALQGGGEVVVVFDICDKRDYASNTTGQLLWGSARVRHLLYDACAPGRLLVVDGRTLSSLQGSQEAAVTYARWLLQHRHVTGGGLRW